MQVMAFSTHSNPQWRWRIVDHNGEMLEESREGFPTIAAAVADGTDRMRALTLRELPERNHTWLGGVSHKRVR